MIMKKEIDKVAFIELKDKKILVSKSYGKSKYYIPGGKRDGNETDHQTLIREVKEELDVDIIKNSINFLGIFKAQADGKETGIEVKMSCYKAEYLGNLKPQNEIEDIKWVNMKDINLVSFVDVKIFNYLHEAGELE